MAAAKEVLETGQELSLVCPADIVFSDPGDDDVLWCHLEPAVSAYSMEIQWWHKNNLVCHCKDRRVAVNTDDRDRVSLSLDDLEKGNVSLNLRDVRTSQTGHYICEVIHENQAIQGNVFLHISSEVLRLVVPQTVSAVPGEDVILPVYLSPETSAVSMNIRWYREAELIYQYENGEEISNNDYENRVSLSIQELQRGNLSLTLRNVQNSDAGKYTCEVFHDRCQKRAVVHLQMRDIERNEDAQRLKQVVRQTHEDLLHQKFKLDKTLKRLEETLDPAGSTFRSRNTSMEGIPPLMNGECGSQNTQTEVSTVTEQDTSHVNRQGTPEHRPVRATQTQQSIKAMLRTRERSSSDVQGQERVGTLHSFPTQTSEDRTQRRRGRANTKCLIV